MVVTCDGKEKPHWAETTGCLLAALASVGYGLMNIGIYQKFTPVYVATECGNQTAELDHIELGDRISVDMTISITCTNPNAYGVIVGATRPGRVWIMDRAESIGNLTLIKGSSLPGKGSGLVNVKLDAELTAQRSLHLVPDLMSNAQIPIFVELQFDVEVGMDFLVQHLHLTAPFKKVCGMYMAGILVTGSSSRLGPMICRDTFEEVDGNIPRVGEAQPGHMSFSAAQMDPGRINLGEKAKTVSCLGMASLSFLFAIFVFWMWCSAFARKRGSPQDAGYLDIAGKASLQKGGFDWGADSDDLGDRSSVGRSLNKLLHFVSCGTMCNRRPPSPRETAALAPRPYWSLPWSRS